MVEAVVARLGVGMKRRSILVSGLAALLLGSASAERAEISAESVQTFYKSFIRLTEEPREVSVRLAALCVTPGPDQVREEEERAGPHAMASVHVYASGVAAGEFEKKERQFPAGSVVVKEKLDADLSVVGIGGMQKMEPGYDSEGGDWQYFHFSESAGFSSGRITTCRSCHARAKSSDFVYFVAPAHR